MSGTDDQGRERRAAPRFRDRFKVLFRTDEEQGSGTLHDISMGGACVEGASIPLKPGTRVRLEFAPRPDCLPVEVRAEVVRETKNGFAVEFSVLDPRLKRLLRSLIDRAEGAARDGDGRSAS